VAQITASPQTVQNVPVAPAGPYEYYSGPMLLGAEVFMFIGAGQDCVGGRVGSGGIPSQGPTSCTPSGLVEGYIESENMDFADVTGVTAKGTLSVNGTAIAQALQTNDTDSAISFVSVSPTSGATYSLNGEAMSCYFASSPIGIGGPPTELPPCFLGCGDPGPFLVGDSQVSVQPDLTLPLPFGAGSCSSFSFRSPVSVTYGLPVIASISQPASANIGTSNNSTLVIGSNLADSSGISSATFANGATIFPGTVPNPNATQETVDFSVPSLIPLGNYQFTISNEWGSSNSVNFTIGASPAVISPVGGLTPPVWQAGTTFPLTITGSGFGTQPTVTISALGVAPVTTTLTSDGSTITVPSVSVVPNAPDEPAVVSVQPGYIGSTFICGTCNGASPVGMDTALVQATTPPPQIMFNGSNIAGASSPTVVFAGQQIPLTVAPPAGYPPGTQHWTFCQIDSSGNCTGGGQQDISGGFTDMNGNQPSAATGGDEAVDPDFTQSAVTFYFVNPGTMEKVTATVTYTQADGTQSTSVPASAVFMINGPSGNLLPQATMLTTTDANGNSNGVQVIETVNNGAVITTTGVTDPNDPNSPTIGPHFGIVFNTSAMTPAGANSAFTWVQILNNVDNRGLVYAGGQPIPQSNFPSGLDRSYPYFNIATNSTRDTPGSGTLLSGWGERTRDFDATMYLMWDPGTGPANCHTASTSNDGSFTQIASNCTSIPIPLGSVRWAWSGCAINTLQQSSGTTWVRSCGKNHLFEPQAAGFPTWSRSVQ
jgi:hypothetical protein